MAITELCETGLFAAIWNWSIPLVTIYIYIAMLVGVLIQSILQNKCRNPIMRWLLIGICGISIIIFECIWHFITYWKDLGFIFIYGLIISMMFGAIITEVISALRNRH